MKKQYQLLPVLLLWAVLTALLWLGPRKDISQSERRPLQQMPAISGKTLLSGSFMKDFEDFTLDQFPLRDTLRGIKAGFHLDVLRQSDNNGIYLAQGIAVGQEYPLDGASVTHAIDRFSYVYDRYLADTGSKVYMAIVPDKGHYLAHPSGHLTLDQGEMTALFREGMPWAEQIDLTKLLSADSYYRTDTHWRQECLLDAASALCGAMGAAAPNRQTYTLTTLERPFYGVYFGQAALPMEPDALSWLESELLRGCTVYDYETGKTGPVYDLTRAEGRDLYEVFLSGPKSLLRIHNPQAETDRELIIFRDSFGSAIAPLLVQGYKTVTLVDIRYLQSSMLDKYLTFQGQDVLFLYSTVVLNNSETIR